MPRWAFFMAAIAGLAALVAVGCGADPADDARPGAENASAAGTVRDSAGVRIIELPDPARLEPRALRVDSSWAGATNLGFGELVDVAVTADGRVALLDRMSARVYVVSADGRVEGSFGRPGQGPGELVPGGLRRVVLTDSSVLVPDLQAQSVTEFRLSGELLGVRRIPVQGFAVDWSHHPFGGVAYRLFQPDGDVLLRWDGQTVDTLFTFEPMATGPNRLLPPVPLWTVAPDGGLLVARSDGRSIVAHGEDGPKWIARLPDADLAFQRSDREALDSILMASVRRTDPGAVSEQVLSTIQYPSSRPRLAALHATPEGGGWLGLAGTVAEMGQEALRVGSADGYGGRLWLVLTPDGRVRAVVELPDGFALRRVADGWAYGVYSNELGIQTPARVRWSRGTTRPRSPDPERPDT